MFLFFSMSFLFQHFSTLISYIQILNSLYSFFVRLNYSLSQETDIRPHQNMQSHPSSSDISTTCVGIAASYDMGYNSRGTGRTYDSLAGHSSLFGYRTKKLLDFDTKTRKCFLCERGHDPMTHDCGGVYQGTAKSMESASAVDLLSDKNLRLKEANVQVDYFIGDGDNSGIAQVRANTSHTVAKLLDRNHTVKSLNNLLFKLKAKYKFHNSVIDYLKKCFGYAVSQNCGDAKATELAIKNVINHAFGDHQNCSDWCKYSDDPINYRHKGLPNGKDLTGEELRQDLNTLFGRFACNAASLSTAGSTQSNESFNHTVNSKAPKSTFYAGTASYRRRVAAAAAQTNLGTKYISKVFRHAGISSGLHTQKYRNMKDNMRLRRRLLRQTKKYKARRNALKNDRRKKRVQQNRGEGVSYMTDVAFLQTPTVLQRSNFTIPQVTEQSLIVYIDIETTGLTKTSEIVQIAAKCAGQTGATFSHYAYPLNGIPLRVREVTGLEINGGQLLLYGQPVAASDLQTLAQNLVSFLKNTGKSIVLVGHNSMSFDFPRIYRLMYNSNLLSEFTSIVCGFVDTLKVFKVDECAKHEPSFKQTALAEKYLPNWNPSGAHEALHDCVTLEELCISLKCDNKLISSCISMSEFLQKQNRLEIKAALEPELQPLRSVLSKLMITRLAENGISMNVLQENYRIGQGESIHVLLAEDDGRGKPKITASKKVINKLVDYLKSSQENRSS